MYCTTHSRQRSSKLSESGCLTVGSASTWLKHRSLATLNVFAASAADSFAGAGLGSLPAACASVGRGTSKSAAMMPQKVTHRQRFCMRFMDGLNSTKRDGIVIAYGFTLPECN